MTRMRQRNLAIVWKLVQMVVSSYGKEFQGASVIVIRKYVTVKMASLFRGIWLSTFLVQKGKSWSWGLPAEYGKKNNKMVGWWLLWRLYSNFMGLLLVGMSETLVTTIRLLFMFTRCLWNQCLCNWGGTSAALHWRDS